MMDVKTDEDGGHVTFSCNVAGYRPEELKVDIEGDSLVVKGFYLFDHTHSFTYIWHFRRAQRETWRTDNSSHILSLGHSSGWCAEGIDPMQHG